MWTLKHRCDEGREGGTENREMVARWIGVSQTECIQRHTLVKLYNNACDVKDLNGKIFLNIRRTSCCHDNTSDY